MNKSNLLVLLSLMILSSCLSSPSTNDTPLTQPEGGTVMVLFSDTSSLQDEKSYYDAFLELQRELKQMPAFIIVERKERDKVKSFNVTTFPTMLVITGDTVSLRMEGPQEKDEILTHLKSLF